MTWQPIETAPRDGTRIDLWMVSESGESYREANAYFVTGKSDEKIVWDKNETFTRERIHRDGWWAPNHDYDGEDGWADQPVYYSHHPRSKRWVGTTATHWMPLPEAPE